MQVSGIDHINLAFPRDRLDEVIDFYVEKLGFTSPFDNPDDAIADDPGLFALKLGNGNQLFVNPSDSSTVPGTGFRHVAVLVNASPTAVKAHLEDSGIAIDSTAERHREPYGDYTSYYVTDPFGYTIECMAIAT